MFNYKSKLVGKVPKKWLKNYKETYEEMERLLSTGKLPKQEDYLAENKLAINLYQRKYFLKGLNNDVLEEKPEHVFLRVASFVAAVEENPLEWAKRFYEIMFNGYFLPGGRVLAGAGDLFRLKTLANCFSAVIEEDSIEAIYKTAYESARTYSYGGGMGTDISVLRPIGSIVHNAADTSTGSVSFMQLFSLTTGLIGQSGRRGALMLSIDVKHPDVIRFIEAKSTPDWTTEEIVRQLKDQVGLTYNQLEDVKRIVMENTQIRFANISIKVTDEFMAAVEEQNKYGVNKILVYKKLKKGIVREAVQDYKTLHYSYGIPSKDLSKYELLKVFETVDELNAFLISNFNTSLTESDLNNINNRDIFGDYVIELKDFNYDIAIHYSGDFLLYFSSKEVGTIKRLIKARDVWNKFIESNYKTAEPGLMFWTRMKKYSPSDYVGAPILGTNPCSEVPLEDGGACNLGSLNFTMFVNNPFRKASFNEEVFKESIRIAVRLLDNIVSWNAYLNPLEKQRLSAEKLRRVGLGIMGMADLLLKFGYDYDSNEALKLLEKILKIMRDEAYLYSAELSKEKGAFPLFNYSNYSKGAYFKTLPDHVKKKIKEDGLRNVALLSIAPTGSLSNIVKSFYLNGKNYIGVSGGIEPIFALYYNRRSESLNKTFKIFHSTVQAYIDMNNLTDEVNSKPLDTVLPSYFFRTAHNIDYIKRVEIQGLAQKYIDHSISSTVNLPEDIEPEVISNIYLSAWRAGLKGITIYREGSRYAVLSKNYSDNSFKGFSNKRFKLKIDGKEYIVKGNEVLVLPNGRLTTFYHAVKNKVI